MVLLCLTGKTQTPSPSTQGPDRRESLVGPSSSCPHSSHNKNLPHRPDAFSQTHGCAPSAHTRDVSPPLMEMPFICPSCLRSWSPLQRASPGWLSLTNSMDNIALYFLMYCVVFQCLHDPFYTSNETANHWWAYHILYFICIPHRT